MDDSVVALQAALAHADFWSSISTLAVAIGVVAELIILFVFTKEIRPAEKAFLVIANVLIVAGCLGEWQYGGSAAAASEKLQSIANANAAKAILDAADANERAARANERAATLEKEAAQLRDKATILTREVGLRHLNGDKLLAILANGPKAEYEIQYGAEDPDSILLAYDLRFLLERAGWKFISLTAVPLAELLKRKWATVITKNVEIEVHSSEMYATPILVPNIPMKRTLYSVLTGAIMAGLGGVQVSRGDVDPTLPANRVRITVLPR